MKRILLPLLLLALAACGGSSSGTSAADSKAAFVTKATQVCKDAGVAKAKAGKSVPTKPDEIAPYVDALVAVAKDAATKLRAIPPPAKDKADLQSKLLDPLDVQVKEGEAFSKKVHDAGQDPVKLLTLLSNRPGAGKIDVTFVKDYGLDVCVKAAEAS